VRRSITLLLMLLLLLTQQSALTHAVRHWAPAVLAATEGDERVSSAPGLRMHTCDFCVAASQFAAVVAIDPFRLRPPQPRAQTAQTIYLQTFLAAPRLGFNSRAPPVS
jgi:hypothetical protein